ncbi:four helix bundle protein [Deinococcus sp. KNUC1210]|uniref:four helix bundle protein n=1 Tax=Deinococcus sp. KNUC1210 TaxID=2917691 RepID=UPI001EF08368|nr:four helix bundle protein [Deinococcus sp. KNUC1210]ULH16764.1 four helix bundle protein [Deinococcus sp. KNUC1210]
MGDAPSHARFESLIVWQKARLLTAEIYFLSRKKEFASDRGLAWQIQRAAVSVMSNLAEGFERGRHTEFHQYVSIAKASCAEVRSQLYVALDIGYITSEEFTATMQLADQVASLCGGLRASLERKIKAKS